MFVLKFSQQEYSEKHGLFTFLCFCPNTRVPSGLVNAEYLMAGNKYVTQAPTAPKCALLIAYFLFPKCQKQNKRVFKAVTDNSLFVFLINDSND